MADQRRLETGTQIRRCRIPEAGFRIGRLPEPDAGFRIGRLPACLWDLTMWLLESGIRNLQLGRGEARCRMPDAGPGRLRACPTTRYLTCGSPISGIRYPRRSSVVAFQTQFRTASCICRCSILPSAWSAKRPSVRGCTGSGPDHGHPPNPVRR